MMAHSHVNSIRQSAGDFNINELSSLIFNLTATESSLGACGHRIKQEQPIRLVAGRHIEDGKLADPTDLFSTMITSRLHKIRRIKFRLRRAGLPRYRIEKIIEAKRHEI